MTGMQPESQEQIDEHNRRSLWNETEGHLSDAIHSLGLAAAALEDLGMPNMAEALKPSEEAVERFRSLAATKPMLGTDVMFKGK